MGLGSEQDRRVLDRQGVYSYRMVSGKEGRRRERRKGVREKRERMSEGEREEEGQDKGG